jgi:signal transduction histidine kinase
MSSLEEGWREFSVTAKDGSLVPSDWSNIYLKDGRAIGVGIDLRDQKKHMQEIKSSYQKLKSLSTHMQSVREEERKNLARNLHDEIGGSYVKLKLDLEKLNRTIKAEHGIDTYEEHVSVMNQLIDSALDRVRNVINELRPAALEEENFLESVRMYLKNFGQRFNLKWSLIHDIEHLKLCEDVTLALFRILQEALLNIARHAEADKVIVRLKQENSNLVLNIIDNGKGFKPDSPKNDSFGILGM